MPVQLVTSWDGSCLVKFASNVNEAAIESLDLTGSTMGRGGLQGVRSRAIHLHRVWSAIVRFGIT